MLQEQIDGLLKCFGGPQAIAVQQVVEWTKGDPSREQFLVQYFAAAIERAKRSRRKK
jgi:hypothetical protein